MGSCKTKMRWRIIWTDSKKQQRTDYTDGDGQHEARHWSKYIESIGGRVEQMTLTSQPKERPDVGARR